MTRVEQVAIVGGGPAGLIAAETLASEGFAVTVYEHKRSVGRKFLLAGRGGLNLTHSEPFVDLVDRYGPASVHLESALRAFTPDDLRKWCAGHQEATFVGTSGRVFPKSFRAAPLLRSWLKRLNDLGVTVATEHRWVGWSDHQTLEFESAGQRTWVTPAATIFALGGASWPRVGSDGSWVARFKQAGIEVSPLGPANSGVQVDWSKVMTDRLAGTPIKNTVFTVGETSVRGDAVVTEAGLEGGPIYALGPALRNAIRTGQPAHLELDLQPDLSVEQLTKRLSKRRPKSSTTSWLSSAGVPAIAVALAREVTENQLPADADDLAYLLKQLAIPVSAMASIDRAISTAGGVDFSALDDRFMVQDRPGTFVAGEMLDWEAPTGGYLLQACFSTGFAAAHGAMGWLAD